MNFYSSSLSQQQVLPPDEPSDLKQSTRKVNYEQINSEQLYDARDRIKRFVHEIGELKNNGIRKDVIDHCDKLKIPLGLHLGFDRVDKMVKNRIDKMIKNRRIKKNWSEQDVLILIWVISKYSDLHNINNVEWQLEETDWENIAQLIPGVRSEACMFKWLSLKKNNLSDNNWSERQSKLLQKVVNDLGEQDWQLISQELYHANISVSKVYRCPKQCREHWNCYLNPKLKKGPWSRQEDELLLKTIKKNQGQKRWADMVKIFNGRTENALKNRYTLIIEKQMKSHKFPNSVTQLQLIEGYLQRIYMEELVNIKNENGYPGVYPKIQASNSYDKKQSTPLFNMQLRKSSSKIQPKQSSSNMQLRKSSRNMPAKKSSYNSTGRPTVNRERIIEQFPEVLDQYVSPEVKYEPLPNIKIQEQSFVYPQINHHSHVIPHLSEHFSSFQRPVKLQSQFFFSNSFNCSGMEFGQQPEIKEQHNQFPEQIEGIEILPLNPELLKTIPNLKNSKLVPCMMINNKLTKID